jgi:hypothetical protein
MPWRLTFVLSKFKIDNALKRGVRPSCQELGPSLQPGHVSEHYELELSYLSVYFRLQIYRYLKANQAVAHKALEITTSTTLPPLL